MTAATPDLPRTAHDGSDDAVATPTPAPHDPIAAAYAERDAILARLSPEDRRTAEIDVYWRKVALEKKLAALSPWSVKAPKSQTMTVAQRLYPKK